MYMTLYMYMYNVHVHVFLPSHIVNHWSVLSYCWMLVLT